MRAPSSRFPWSFRPLLRGALIGTALFPAWHAMGQPYALPASDPQAPVAPLVHRSVAASPSPLEAPSVPWREANDAVAATPRGHADIVAWEARNSQTPPSLLPGHGAHPHPHTPLPARGAP